MIADPDYARVYTQVRCVAHMYGYAALVHGSFTRDLDILMVPWTPESSAKPEHLIALICDRCGLEDSGHEPSLKAHGRLVYTLLFAGNRKDPRFIDIGFMPLDFNASYHRGIQHERDSAVRIVEQELLHVRNMPTVAEAIVKALKGE